MDDLNVDHYNIDDIFDLVDVPKYDFEELIEVLDIYADAYTKENSIILTNFILQIKSKVMDYIQSIGLEYTTNTDSYKTIDTNKNIESDGYNRNEMKKYQEDPINSVIDIVPRSDTPESNLEYLEEDDIIENDKFVYNPSISIDDTKYTPVGNNLNNSASTNNLLQEVMPNFTQALGEELPSSMTQDQVSRQNTQNTQNTQKPLNQFEEDYVEKVLIFNSGFRKPAESINDYLIDMAEPLQNVTSLQLTSYTLTYNIYNIDEHNQTNVLFMTDSRFKEHIITVKSGYYTTPEQLVSQINTTINEHFTSDGSWNETDPEDSTNASGILQNMSSPQPVTFEYDSLNGRVRIKVEKPDRHPNTDNPDEQYNYPNRSRTGPFIMYITFFSLSQGSTTKYNFNLGYFLGFRRFFLNSTKGIGYYVEFKNGEDTEGQTDVNNPTITNVTSTDPSFNVIETEGMVDLKHPKYLMLSLDEFNQNRANSNVIQVNDGTNNTVRDMLSRLELPKNPRQRPLAHIYAHNERIIGNMNELRKQRIRNYPQTIPDTFADIPFPSELNLGSIINNQGQNTASIPPRKYFGPINIKRFRVRLFDEKGNLVNLNNTDYTFSVKLKMLYNNNVIKSSQIESGDIESEDIESKNNDTKKD
jgi:hypothetical protein